MSQNKMRLSWILWHPHQGLWNWTLVDAIKKIIPISPINKMIQVVIILIDSTLLFIRALTRRISILGVTRVFERARLPEDISLVYMDIGTHKEGQELSFAIDTILPKIGGNFVAYGFEASNESYKIANQKFSGREDTRIIHKALCCTLPRDGKIRLYKDDSGGIGDSLYRITDSYEEVDAMRLSEFMRQNDIVKPNRLILLRMNIEGAEFDVIRDLIESGYSRSICGYFGMWDDVSKIDTHRDDEFREFLSMNHINTFPFNGRDLSWSLRKKCITYHMHTCILHGLTKIEKNTVTTNR